MRSSRALIMSLVLAGCGGAPRTAATAAPAPACPAPIAAATPAPAPAPAPKVALDEQAVIEMSHAFMDSMDRSDIAAFTDQVGPTFVMFQDARFLNTEFVTKMLQARLDRHAAARTRTWSDEHVFLGDDAVIFIARAIEHIAAETDHPAAEYDGYNTLVWVRDGARWKVAQWEWVRGGLEAGREHWNDIFRAGVGFRLEPNQLLIDTLKGKKPGTALDLEMGQGRNAIYIASQGWKTTGVDISDEGIKIAKAAAAKRKLKLDAIEADVNKWDLGTNRWDLVTMIYAGNDLAMVDRIKPSVKKGGLFVTEYFASDSDAAKAGAGGWDDAALAARFKDGWKILRDDVVEDIADYSLRKMKLVRFVAQKL